MMSSRGRWGIALLAVGLALVAVVPAGQGARDGENPARRRAAFQAVLALEARLRTEILGVYRSAGPLAAAQSYREIVERLSATVGEERGVTLRRVRLLPIGRENAADAWERKQLAEWARKVSIGADPSQLEHFEVITSAGGVRQFRYMRGLRAEVYCLGCHGSQTRAAVRAVLQERAGDASLHWVDEGGLLGAVSVIQTLE
ncbi:MAG: DUF3365 domain-containing protein [Hyphomicrobiaceae bacterium]|nr:DUF3365 domain-containing protein [Hyphomicrobiaceae bacterium]